MSVLIQGYSFDSVIWAGHSSTVYRGVRGADRMPVVAKVLAAEFPSPRQLARFRHEYRLLQSLDDSGIIKALALEKVGNSLALILEDCGAVSLGEFMARSRLDLADKLKIADRIAEILGVIHGHGIVHKDINPSNILIKPDNGEIKFIDFECASILDHEDGGWASPELLEGTLAFMAPEQTGRMNRPVDYRSDYYSLGVTLYELFSGALPFDTEDGMAMVHMHMAVAAPALHALDSAIPEAVSEIVRKLMEKNAENRYQSIVGIRQDLKFCLGAVVDGYPLEGFVAGLSDVHERFSIPAKLYGREAEVERLLEIYRRVCAGDSSIVMVAGYSGIGKSMLINEIHKPIVKHRGFFVAGKFDQYRRNKPYSAIIQALRELLRQILTESAGRVAEWRERLLAALAGNAGVLIEVLPELGLVTGPQPEAPALGPQEAQNRFNLCFRNFVQVFSRPEHPLTLFLDDLQWADNPSLGLLELLGGEGPGQCLLVVGAYRENEVDAAHPLRLMLGRLAGRGAAAEALALGPLAPAVVREIVADTVGRRDEAAAGLADLVCRKTEGNPFFINQLLTDLHARRLLRYDPGQHAWDWDIGEIEQVGITDNVVELMAQNIRKLPAGAQAALQLAACVGNVFCLRDIALAGESDGNAAADDLLGALKAGLVVPLGDGYKLVGGQEAGEGLAIDARYRFLHDRVQQAAYDLLDPQERAQTHLKIGARLLENAKDGAPEERLFDIAGHFNQGFERVFDPALRLELAGLNLKAAAKARDAIAYEPALEFANMAEKYLAGLEDPPRPLKFRARFMRAECEYLNGRRDAAEPLYQEALALAEDTAGKIEVFEAMVHFHTNFGEFENAYRTGREGLKLLGVNAPAKFVPPLFVADLLRAKWLSRGRKAKDLADLPVCAEDGPRSAMRLIAAYSKAAYQIQPELCVANAVKAVNLCLRHGAMEDIAVPFAVVGCIFLGGVVGKHRLGYEFGQLALALNQRFDNVKQRSEVNFVTAYFSDFWLRPAEETEAFYRRAYETGLQTGDFFHLSCAACTLVESQYLRGVPLAEVKQAGEGYLAFMERIQSHEAGGAITAVLRAVENLEGKTDSPASFGGAGFDEAAFAARLRGFTSLHFAHFYFVNKMQALYLWGFHGDALAMAQESESFLKYSIAMLHTVEHHFYHALVLCAAHAQTPRRALLARARKILKMLDRWAADNPANFEDRALLVRAELAARERGGWRATRLYSAAMRAADRHGHPHIRALAAERAGRFLSAAGEDVAARAYLREAFYGYQSWGASGLADKLAGEFPQAFYMAAAGAEAPARPTSVPVSRTLASGSSAHGQSWLDLDTVIKATRAISSEIHLAALLQKMMAIIIENAGAEKGYFLRPDLDGFRLEAEAAMGAAEVAVLAGTGLSEQSAPLSLLHYVLRTGESVVLDDAGENTRFAADAYIAGRRPKSVLCAPVVHQSVTIGLVYLENNLSTGVFTAERLGLIEVLAAQAAISLENSLLYANLEQRVQERTRELALATEKLMEANKQLERLSLTDGLTGVSNKRHFQEVYEREWKRAVRAGGRLAVLLIDIDCFKLFNDTYGHMDGDRCLKAVAGALSSQIYREGDFLARFGGEEFAIILPGSDAPDAEHVAGRLVQAVRDLGMPHKSSLAAEFVTISLGAAVAEPTPDGDPQALVQAADEALYRAKTGGRNRFSF